MIFILEEKICEKKLTIREIKRKLEKGRRMKSR